MTAFEDVVAWWAWGIMILGGLEPPGEI